MRAFLVAAAVMLGFCIAPVAQASAYPSVTYTSHDSTVPLNITAPGVYDGQHHKVPSINVQANGVTVQNFVVQGGKQVGIFSQGNGNVIQDNDISQISYGTDDLDAMRFFGNGVQILRNHVHNLIKGPLHDAHPDGLQTWTSAGNHPGSSAVTIADNEWLGLDFHQCITAEGPKSTGGGGGGSGFSASWTIRGNHCQGTSNQAIVLRGITVVQVLNNRFDGKDAKAVQVADGSTVSFSGNTLGRNVGKLSGD